MNHSVFLRQTIETLENLIESVQDNSTINIDTLPSITGSVSLNGNSNNVQVINTSGTNIVGSGSTMPISGSINATCTGTLAVTNTGLTNLNNTINTSNNFIKCNLVDASGTAIGSAGDALSVDISNMPTVSVNGTVDVNDNQLEDIIDAVIVNVGTNNNVLRTGLSTSTGTLITNTGNALDVNLKTSSITLPISNSDITTNTSNTSSIVTQLSIPKSITCRDNSNLNFISMFGKSSVIGTVWTSIAYTASTMPYPRFGYEQGQIVYVLSDDNTNDTSAGANARSVYVEGYNSSGALINETINLNGTTPVVSINSYWGIRNFYVNSWGDTKWNNGTIFMGGSANVYTSNIPNTIISIIPPTKNYAKGPTYVPYYNKNLYPMSMDVSNYSGSDADIALISVTPVNSGSSQFFGFQWANYFQIEVLTYIHISANTTLSMNLRSCPRFSRDNLTNKVKFIAVMAKTNTGTASVSYALKMVEK